MKNFFCIGLAALLLVTPSQARAQGVGIGSTALDASVVLAIVSSKGALLPCVGSTSAVNSLSTGLLVF